ncbi:MAG: citrate synthase [Candidatus Latescibacterota bacterium]|jgi:citrate synthase
MSDVARLQLGDQTIELPVIVGSENEPAVDVASLRAKTGYITLDEGFRNTGSCQSSICFIDGEQGILRYRGIPIEELAERSNFLETACLIIWGELPELEPFRHFCDHVRENMMLHEEMRHHFEAFPPTAPPMAILSAMINALSCFHPELLRIEDEDSFHEVAAHLLAKAGTLAAFAYKFSVGQPAMYPRPDVEYCTNFLHMMFSRPYAEYHADPEVARALDLLLLLHAEHEQNCSTSTVRMVGSSGASLSASVAAGVCALWGPAHGGANVAVIEQLEWLQREKLSVDRFLERVKQHEVRLMGFGHAVYRNFDPRAKVIKAAADRVLGLLNRQDPLLDLAKELEEKALADDYFTERKLYPNVDFYSGVILRAIGIPHSMFTVMFAIGRMPGWIAHWREMHFDPEMRISRPRQIYTGPPLRHYIYSFAERTGTQPGKGPICAPGPLGTPDGKSTGPG